MGTNVAGPHSKIAAHLFAKDYNSPGGNWNPMYTHKYSIQKVEKEWKEQNKTSFSQTLLQKTTCTNAQ